MKDASSAFRRPLRREIAPLAFAAALPLAFAAAVPQEMFSFRPAEGTSAECSCAFVTLSPEAERRALARARASWQTGAEGMRGLRAEMLSSFLSESVPDEIVGFDGRIVPPAVGDERFAAPPRPPSLALPAPPPLAPDRPEPAAPAFPRDELLRFGDRL